MKLNIFIIIFFLLCTFKIQAQDLYNNLVISSKDSIKFNLSINGFQQTVNPYNNIKITHIYDQSISIQINTQDSLKQVIKKIV